MPARRRRSQAGYALLVVLLVFSLFVISLAMAIPRWKTEIQRDRENEAVDRAHQYVEGIKRYYHKFGSYPPNLERLKETNGIHYLRQAWPDPLTPDGKWKLLQFSDLKSGEIVGGGMGFPGMQGKTGTNGAPTASNSGSLFGGSLGSTSTTGLGSGLGSSTGLGDSGSTPGAGLFSGSGDSNSSDDDSTPSTTSPGSSTGASGSGTAAPGTAAGATAASGSTSESPSSSSASSSTMKGGLFGGTSAPGAGHVFGGTGIVGVASTSKKPAVHAFNRKHRPDQWQFVYSPMQDRSLLGPGVGNGPALGQQPGQSSSSSSTSGSFGSTFGGTQPTSTGSGSSGSGTDGDSGTSNPGGGLFGDSGSH